jgi:rod shape-determining protein MreC
VAVAVLRGQLLLLAARAPDRQEDAANLLAGATFRALAPVLGAVSWVADRFESFGHGRRARGVLETENRRLKEELALLRRERLRLAGLDAEVEELARGLAYARQSGLELRAAEVVYADRGSWLRALILRVGARGARLDQAVLAEDGVVGRVIASSGPWAKVQLVTDRASAVGVELESARRQGIARGEGDELLIDYVPRQAEVTVGERVLTAGIDGVYPRGLPVGVVVAVEPGTGLFHLIRVRPAVELSQLSTLFLLERGPEPPRAEPSGSEGQSVAPLSADQP